MIYTQISQREALDKLTEGDNGLSILAAEAVLDDTLAIINNSPGICILDFDAMKHSWLEEKVSYVLEVHDAESLDELDGDLYWLEPEGMEDTLVYLYLDSDRGIRHIPADK